MLNSPPIRPRRKPSEEGYLLLSVMFLLALLLLSLAVAAPSVAKSIQRDRDVETMERGKQYIRAVQLYYRKFHAYPPTIDALVKTNDIRFLRKRYLDPITGKDDWKPILFGQNKVPTAMGFFGQPLSTGGAIAGVGPTSGNGINGVNGQSGGLFNSSGGSGQTFGGAGIIGFSPASPKQSILIYKKKDHYNEWEFTYDPIMDMVTAAGGNTGMIGQPAGAAPGSVGIPGITTPGTGDTNTPGSPGTGNNPSNPTGTAPVTPPETPAPQP